MSMAFYQHWGFVIVYVKNQLIMFSLSLPLCILTHSSLKRHHLAPWEIEPRGQCMSLIISDWSSLRQTDSRLSVDSDCSVLFACRGATLSSRGKAERKRRNPFYFIVSYTIQFIYRGLLKSRFIESHFS